MDENDEILMAEYGITAEAKFVFHYDGRRYDRLADAVNYARMQRTSAEDSGALRQPGEEVG